MANTANYNWPLPSPSGLQMNEVAKIATSFTAIDAKIKAFETSFSNHKHKFADLEEKPTTLGGYGITDGMTAVEVAQAIKTAVDDLINGSGAALDTLKELADALGNDPEFAATVGNALGVRVRVDAAQAFTLAEKAQGRSNIDALGMVDKGKADGVASLDSTGKVPPSQLPALTTTATVGAAMAGANGKTTPDDGDAFTGVEAGSSTMFKTTWGNIKAALSALFYTKSAADDRFYTKTNANNRYVDLNSDTQEIYARKVFKLGSQGGDIGANTQGAIEIQPNPDVNTDAFMSFHVPAASKRINLGFRPAEASLYDSLHIGGGSMGATSRMIYNSYHFGLSGDANRLIAGGNTYDVYNAVALRAAITNLSMSNYRTYVNALNDSIGCTVYGRYTAKGANVAVGTRIPGSQLNVAKANGGGWGDGGVVFGGTWVSLTGENAGSSDRGCWKKLTD